MGESRNLGKAFWPNYVLLLIAHVAAEGAPGRVSNPVRRRRQTPNEARNEEEEEEEEEIVIRGRRQRGREESAALRAIETAPHPSRRSNGGVNKGKKKRRYVGRKQRRKEGRIIIKFDVA